MTKLLLRGLVSLMILNLKEAALYGYLVVLILRVGGWSVGQSQIKAKSASVVVEVKVEAELDKRNIQLIVVTNISYLFSYLRKSSGKILVD